MKIAVNTSALDVGDLDLSIFKELGEVVCFGEVSRQELYSLASDCDAIVVNKVEVNGEFFDACPKIRYVGTFATGYNVVDIDECKKRNITVCNVPDYSTRAVSQHVFALLLCFYNSVDKYVKSVKEGDWTKSKTFCYFTYPTHELFNKTFGIYGYGNIGRATAKIAEAFGANVVVCTRTPPKDCQYKQVSFEEMLKTCDIISLHCPLTPQTAKLIDKRAISLMKENCVLVNTARGGLVDEDALAEALNTGRIAGACLDTVAVEPMLETNPLLGAKNCLITPHVAWVAKETRQRLIGIACENLRAFISGKPQNVVS